MKNKLSDKKLEELKIEVYGRVQGVGLRHFVKAEADKIGLKGYVMNKDNGVVLVVAQGNEDSLRRFLAIIQKGPMLAKIEGISYFWKKPENKYEDFIIALDKGMLKDQTRNFLNLGKKVFNIKEKVPRHVAIIPDGNRRWAKEKGLQLFAGHEKSASFGNIIPLLKEAQRLGIKYITIWSFSTENWQRSKKEVDYLFKLIKKFSQQFQEYAIKNKIRFRHLGRKDRLPKEIVEQIQDAEEKTKEFDRMYVQVCLDYGGRDEIVRAINKILKAGIQEIRNIMVP